MTELEYFRAKKTLLQMERAAESRVPGPTPFRCLQVLDVRIHYLEIHIHDLEREAGSDVGRMALEK